MASNRSAVSTGLMLAGAGLAGAGIALLLAPRSGRETREKLKTDADELKRKASDGWSSAKTRLDASLEEARTAKDRLAAVIRRTGRAAKEEYRTSKNQASEENGNTTAGKPMQNRRNWMNEEV